MILAIPYSHTDLEAALRLVRWIGWLSEHDHRSMKRETVLLVPSRAVAGRALTGEILEEARKVFGKVLTHRPATEYEKGWPGACNFMFKETLEYAEKLGEDMFLLEPDATPLTPEWWECIQKEWERFRGENERFMGAYVPLDIPHMSGIGVYGRGWRAVAPKLAEVQDFRGWDTYAAVEVVPHTYFTPLVQHIQWKTSSWKYEKMSIAALSGSAVIFHQDKEGRVMRQIDQEYFRSGAEKTMGLFQAQPKAKVSMKYFINHNLNRPVTHHGLELLFDPLDQIAGTWRGIVATEDEAEIVALQTLVSDPASGIHELTLAEYEERTKKKVSLPFDSGVTVPAGPAPGKSQINPVPAVLVEEPAAAGNVKADVDGGINPVITEDLDKVIKVGKVKLPEHVSDSGAKSRKKAPRK